MGKKKVQSAVRSLRTSGIIICRMALLFKMSASRRRFSGCDCLTSQLVQHYLLQPALFFLRNTVDSNPGIKPLQAPVGLFEQPQFKARRPKLGGRWVALFFSQNQPRYYLRLVLLQRAVCCRHYNHCIVDVYEVKESRSHDPLGTNPGRDLTCNSA